MTVVAKLGKFSLVIDFKHIYLLKKPLNVRPVIEVFMKKGIHPTYRPVIFKDVSCDFAILTRSTIQTPLKETWTDGKEYPLVRLDISSASHPFYTGKHKVLDTEGRIEKFRKKFGEKYTQQLKKKK